jgi:hypothetical protein
MGFLRSIGTSCLLFFTVGAARSQDITLEVHSAKLDPVIIYQIKANTVKSDIPPANYKWLVFDNGIVRDNVPVWPDGKQVFLTYGPDKKHVDVILWVEGLKPAIIEFNTDANTNTNENKNLSNKYNLRDFSYSLVMTKVKTLTRAQESQNLSKSYSSVASQILQSVTKQKSMVQLDQNDLKTDDDSILQKIAQSNRDTLGTSATAWQDWNVAYGDYVYKLFKDKKINSPEDWAQAFKETAEGLSSVR